jgi:hypothetical protein
METVSILLNRGLKIDCVGRRALAPYYKSYSKRYPFGHYGNSVKGYHRLY